MVITVLVIRIVIKTNNINALTIIIVQEDITVLVVIVDMDLVINRFLKYHNVQMIEIV